jgi:hypothetical protein
MELLNSDNIYKLKPGLISRKVYQHGGKSDIISHYEYGHIKVGDNQIRLSTCLDLNTMMVTYPIEEQQYLKCGQFIYFTSGDMFLLVINSLLENETFHHRKTDKKNYEINISSLFEMGAVYHYGLIDYTTRSFETDDGIHPITKQLPELFLKANLRGCMIGQKPHYILGRLENSGSESHFDWEMWTNYRDIFFAYQSTNAFTHHQTIGIQARRNTEKMLRGDINYLTKRPGMIKAAPGVTYMIFDWQITNDIERIRRYCNMMYHRYLKK